jgi:aryl-alcohol dehydrogenase-like predicted oxidoreductase
MKYRKFGNTDLQVSEIGFGAWAIGGNAMVGSTPIGWGKTRDDESVAALRAAIDAGINFIDTADFYGLGHSEELIGKLFGSNRKVIIATKVGHRNIDERIVFDYTADYIHTACEKSLKRLKRDVIDYYQLHTARMEHLQKGECIQAMEDLKKQGKIRYWGLSLNTFYPRPEAEYLIKHRIGDGFQLVFNVINQRAAEVLKLASSAGYGVIARMPLQFGLLTGKIKTDAKFESGDHRSFRLIPSIIEKANAILDKKVWPVAVQKNISKTSLALSYILSHPQISTVIPGIRTVQQAEQNTTGILQLDEDTVEQLDGLKSEFAELMEVMEKQG